MAPSVGTIWQSKSDYYKEAFAPRCRGFAAPPCDQRQPGGCPGFGSKQYAILHDMKVEEIAEAVAKLPPDQLARFRRWFTAFEAGRSNHELDSTASRLGRLAGRALAELKKRAKEP
jgi:hypothetical protein